MTADELRTVCLGRPGAEETFPFSAGTSVFKVAAKIFAIAPLGDDPLTVSVKCEPHLSEDLRMLHASVEPGYHLNKRHWITITLNRDVGDVQVTELIELSHELVAPKPRPRRRRSG